MIATIKSINEVDSNGHVYVSLCNMRADLTDYIEINPADIPNYFGVDRQGYSVERRIKVGVKIEYDGIHPGVRRMENPRFIE